MDILVILIKNGGVLCLNVHTNNNHDSLSVTTIFFSKGIVFLILVFPLKLNNGLSSGSERHPYSSSVDSAI
jgi:hypothetical protein